MILPDDAIITQVIKNESEEKKVGSIILTTGVDTDVYHKVIYTGKNMEHLKDKIIRPKESMGEDLDINYKPFKFFASGQHSYFYIND